MGKHKLLDTFKREVRRKRIVTLPKKHIVNEWFGMFGFTISLSQASWETAISLDT
jgi:hypothetical protein